MPLFILTDDTFFTRTLLGFFLALGISLVARRAGALSRSGAAAATVVGTIAVAAGWSWAALLIGFFASATLLSSWRREEKARRTAGVVAKNDERDWVQVLANGALFAAAALMFKLRWLLALGTVDDFPAWTAGWAAIGAGALAAACADTWSTEIGTLSATPPRLITTLRGVPAGTSGAVTVYGLGGMLGGALWMGAIAWLVRWPPSLAIATGAGGLAGALADSVIGAVAQERRRCPKCDAPTERDVHDCGTDTVPAGGLAWLDNDAVNALSTGIGALASFVVWRVLA